MEVNKPIRLSRCSLSCETIDFVKKALDSSYLGMGQFVEEFENRLSTIFSREVIAVSSGTTALHLAIESLDLAPNDEIIAPSITYLATFQAIAAAGVKPVACDVDINGQININSVLEKINSRTKAIIPVHYAGNSFDIDELYKLANSNNLRVIEDAAHAFGSKFNGKMIGSFGDIVCFSFDGIKNITCGEGGCIVTDDSKLKEKIKAKRSLGVEKDYLKRYKNNRTWEPKVTTKGWRAHMSNINAAIGLSQLEIMHDNFKKRRKLSSYYYKKLNFLSEYIKVVEISKEHVPHIFPIILIDDNRDRDQLRNFLLSKNIETGIHYYPCHLLDFFKTKDNLHNANFYYERTLSLPLHPELEFDQIDYIVEKLENFFIKM